MNTFKKYKKWWLGGLIIAALATFSVGISWSTSVEPGLTYAKQGRVVDAVTGKPIAGAWVVAQWWHGQTVWFVEGSRGGGCFYDMTVQTDANGVYQIPDTRKEIEVEYKFDPARRDSYGTALVIYAPDYYKETTMIEHAKTLSERDAVYRMGFRSSMWRHPQLAELSRSQQTARIEDIQLTPNQITPAMKVAYLDHVREGASCRYNERAALVPVLFREAYRTACVNNPTFSGIEYGVINLWREAASSRPPDRIEREKTISKIGKSPKTTPYYEEYTLEDRKTLCALMQPEAGESP